MTQTQSTAASQPDQPTIVVGIDGSEPSRQALRWAARQAKLTGAKLHVVICWELPSLAYMSPLPAGLDFEGDTRTVLQATLEEELGADAAQVETSIAEGHPAPVLVEQSKYADLLVVGSRGHGAFTGMLLGSVSEHCVTHAQCPVVVVRGPKGHDD